MEMNIRKKSKTREEKKKEIREGKKQCKQKIRKLQSRVEQVKEQRRKLNEKKISGEDPRGVKSSQKETWKRWKKRS